MTYDKQISHISDLIGRKISTIKQLGRPPIGLTKFDYISKVLPQIDNYAITDKADGTHGVIEISAGSAKCIVGSDYFEITDIKLNDSAGRTDATLTLSCEVLLDKKTILIFDILQGRPAQLLTSPFSKRLEYMKTLAISHKEWKFSPKKFWTLTTATYAASIMELYSAMKKYPYNTDGIIFTSLNDKFNDTRHYKWKPPEHLTIDFLVVRGSSGPELWSGISRQLFKKLGMHLPANYQIAAQQWCTINSGVLHNEYFPVPFSPTCRPNIYKAPIKGVSGPTNKKSGLAVAKLATKLTNAPSTALAPTLIGTIIEVSWHGDHWQYHRTRTDRRADLASGTYFGNNYEIAEVTFQSIQNPLTIKELVAPLSALTKDFYFEKSDNQYKAARAFNNYVKTQMMGRISYKSYIIDMASGKGQDLVRYYANKVRNLLALEIDASALDELVTRKYSIAKAQWVDRLNAPIQLNARADAPYIVASQMDLNQPADKNLAKIHELVAPDTFRAGTIDAIVCNMALHYMMADAAHIDNIAKFIAHWLKEGGEFMFTSLDGAKIISLLKSGPWESGPYKIQYGKKSDHSTIAVLLPCSRDLREEPLVNLGALDKALVRHKIIRTESKSFADYLATYKDSAALTPADKQFVALYQYSIYKKIK